MIKQQLTQLSFLGNLTYSNWLKYHALGKNFMKLSLLLVADYANITDNGKLNVMGIFQEINSYSFPARHSSMHLVIKLVAELGEFGETRDLKIQLSDGDGAKILEITGPIQIPDYNAGKKPEVNAIIELKDVIFPKPGPYQFVVLVDKDYKGDTRIQVNKLEAEPLNQG